MLTISFRMSSQTDDCTVASFIVYVLHPADGEGLGSLLLGGIDVHYTVAAEEECKFNHLSE